MRHALIVTAVSLLAAVACASANQSGSGTTDRLTILAAASLGNALEKARSAYLAVSPGTTMTVATGSSSALLAQIEQGAPADLFLSADTASPQRLVEAGLADGQIVAFARNRLTIVVPADNPAGIATPADLARDGIRIVAAGDGVPVSRYAREVVDELARLPGYPEDFAGRYAANIVSREDNVRAVAVKIALGEGDAGIVYATDGAASPDVVTIPIPDEANATATYAGVVVGSHESPEVAHAFLDWLAGPGGQAVLAEFGFLPPS